MENIIEYLKAERSQEWRSDLRKGTKAKERTNLERVKMPEEDPFVRNTCNVEVNIGLNAEAAVLEAKRCLDCANPTCIDGCPVGINIPKFIKRIESEDFAGAAVTLKETNAYIKKDENGYSTKARSTRELTGMKYSRNVKQLKKENELLAEAHQPLIDAGLMKSPVQQTAETDQKALLTEMLGDIVKNLVNESLEEKEIVN